MTSGTQWRLKRTFYMETRRHFKKTWRYRLTFNLKQAVVPFILLRHGPVPRMEPMAAAMGSHGHHIPVVRPPLRMQNRMVQPFGTCIGRTPLPPVFPLVRNAAARMARLFVDGLPDRSTHTVLPQSFLKQSREIVCT